MDKERVRLRVGYGISGPVNQACKMSVRGLAPKFSPIRIRH